MNSDIITRIASRFRGLYIFSGMLISTSLMKGYAAMTGIQLGKQNLIFGRATFIRIPKSIIKTGANCRFRNKSTSNLIGINHRCIMATHSPGAEIIIGDNCGFSGTVIGAFSSIRLGNNVRCGANTLITDSDWHPGDPRVGPAKPIVIGDNVWLGYGVVVMKGVTIGENSVIGAGSIVSRDIPANVIAAGNPCKVVKQIQ